MIVRLRPWPRAARRARRAAGARPSAAGRRVSNTTADSIGRWRELPRRSMTARARSRSASEISQWRAVIVVCMDVPPGSGAARAGDDVAGDVAPCRLAVRSQVRLSAKRRAPAPSARPAAGAPASSSIRPRQRPRRRRAAPGSRSRRGAPSRASPGLSEASDGVPHAAASTTVMPQPSLGDGKTFAQARRSSAIFSSSLTKPWNATALGEPQLRASAARARGR